MLLGIDEITSVKVFVKVKSMLYTKKVSHGVHGEGWAASFQQR